MKKVVITLTIAALIVSSCGGQATKQTPIESSQKRIETAENNIKETSTTFYIKDETKYSENFLSEFKKHHGIYETVSLIEDTIMINNDRDGLIVIPTDLPLNETVTYEKTANEKAQILTLKRVNISTVEYSYHEAVNDKKVNDRAGSADLQPTFYLGTQGTFEDEDENVYGMNRYIDYSEKDCWTYIYVGVGNIEKSLFTYGCETDREKINTPELIRK